MQLFIFLSLPSFPSILSAEPFGQNIINIQTIAKTCKKPQEVALSTMGLAQISCPTSFLLRACCQGDGTASPVQLPTTTPGTTLTKKRSISTSP